MRRTRDVKPILQADFDYSACTFNSGDRVHLRRLRHDRSAAHARPQSGYGRGRRRISSSIATPARSVRTTPPPTPTTSVRSTSINVPTSATRPACSPTSKSRRPDGLRRVHVHEGPARSRRSRRAACSARNSRCRAPIRCGAPSRRSCSAASSGCSTAEGSTDTVQVTVGKRNVEGGGRQSDITHESFRTVLGMRGDINDTWSYDAYGQYGESQLGLTFFNDFSLQRTARALDVQIDRRLNPDGTQVAPPSARRSARRSSTASDPACVPYNPWQPGAITQDQLNYLQIPLVQRGQTTERVANVSFTGDLANYGVKLPTAQTGLLVNARRRMARGEERAAAGCSVPVRRRRRPGRSDSADRRRLHREGRLRRSAHGAARRQAVRAEPVGGSGLSLLRLQPRLQHRHVQGRTRVDADPGHPRARQLPACGACAERLRAVRRADGRPRRHDRRVRRSMRRC